MFFFKFQTKKRWTACRKRFCNCCISSPVEIEMRVSFIKIRYKFSFAILNQIAVLKVKSGWSFNMAVTQGYRRSVKMVLKKHFLSNQAQFL